MLFDCLTDPFFLAHRALRTAIRSHADTMRGIVLDVGCGAAPYRQLFMHATYIGMEVPAASLHGSTKQPELLFDGRQLPIKGASVDAVLCSQVLEHIFEPEAFLREIHGVLRADGHVLLTVPFVWDEHEQPYDFARYSSFGLNHLAEKSGFRVTASSRTLADASLFAQLWLAYLFKVVRPLPAWLRKLVLGLAIGPTNGLGMLLGRVLPGNPDLYLDNVVMWIKSTESDSHAE